MTWETVSEADTVGYNVYRADASSVEWIKLNDAFIAALTPGASSGNAYEFVDPTYSSGYIYLYAMEAVGMDGRTDLSDPVEVNLEPQAQ